MAYNPYKGVVMLRLHKCLLISFFLHNCALLVHPFVQAPQPLFSQVIAEEKKVEIDQSGLIARILALHNLVVIKFTGPLAHRTNQVNPIKDFSPLLPSSMQSVVKVYEVNAGRCPGIIKSIESALNLKKMSYPAICFFQNKKLVLPIEEGSMSADSLMSLIQGRISKTKSTKPIMS